MRKFWVPVLLATAMVPATAMAADRHQDRGEHSRFDRGDRGDRSESRGSKDRAPSQATQTQRSYSDGPRDRSSFTGRRDGGDAPAATQRRYQGSIPTQVEDRRDAGDRTGRRSNFRDMGSGDTARPQGGFTGVPATTTREYRDGRRDGNWDGRRDDRREYRDGRRDDRREYRDGRRDDRRDGNWDGRRDRDNDHRWDSNRRWSNDWRHDNRYNWRSYRNDHRWVFRLGRYYDPYRYGYRRFSIGFTLWPSYYSSNFWLNDPWMYRLPPAYGPYRWVRYYDDALLVNIYTGQVVDVIYDFFW